MTQQTLETPTPTFTLDPLEQNLSPFCQAIKEGQSLVLEGLWDCPKAALIALTQQITNKNILVLTGASKEESRLFHDLRYLSGSQVLDFPAWETLPSENIAPSSDIVGERYKILRRLTTEKNNHIILTNLHACLQRLIPPETFHTLFQTIKVGDTIPFDKLIQQLTATGYRRTTIAADKGEFAVRGGIIDLFPVSSPDPFRIEFWGDEIESLRAYDPVGQKSVRPVEELQICPGRELELLQEAPRLASILDYLGPDTLIIFDDLLALEDRYVSLINIPGTLSKSFCSIEDFIDEIQSLQTIYWSHTQLEQLCEVKISSDTNAKDNLYSTGALHSLHFQMFNRSFEARRWNHPFEKIANFLRPPELSPDEELSGQEILLALSACPPHYKVQLLCNTESDEQHLQEQIQQLAISLPPNTTYERGYLSSGMALPAAGWLVLPLTEITKRYKIRRQKLRSTYHTASIADYELLPGDNVVHLTHGIGRYLGMEQRPNHEGVQTEFFVIEYAKGSKVYVPMTQSHLLTKYVGAKDETINLHTIGGKKWQRTKVLTQKAIMGYASDLLNIYAQRSLDSGFQYPADSKDTQRFHEDFPFVETEDQISAIQHLSEDMESSRCMDRLICGDVGYGKTEVAMRAAFKAVAEGSKQVAVLVPTTMLAMQHYETFVERMQNYPVNIGVLSRFCTPKQARQTLENTASGGIDILIGTHRIVSKDVSFKNLGLIIIDEEQRFGVRVKEHLKKIKTNVDCLTLSATPIPRTLYLSLLGARDMSVITTPPQDRMPIKTIVSETDDNTIRNALLRELSRDGQVFIIHNRVETIYDMANKIKKLLPQARVVVGHGQMSTDEIDTVFHAFKSGKADILIATTIVENGIDIPNANTILIDRADRFGLADLYQLRGRVGRWNRQAYAYFLTPKRRVLSETAYKRLQALHEASGYGGGMKIAMRDLEIRGAGDILGTEQSGHVEAVGFHLYCKLLKRTVEALQGNLPATLTDTKIEFPFDAKLPEEYVNAASLRMEIYQRLGETMSLEEVDVIWKELKDRFGPPPEPTKWLYHITRIRVFASRHSFTLLKIRKNILTAERQQGKKTTTQQIPIRRCAKPADLETSIITTLKKVFCIKT